MEEPTRSLKGLDWVNLLTADVRDGVGVYLSVYLLTMRHWQQDEIGLVIAVPGLIGILVQAPAGALIDRTTYKRLLLARSVLTPVSSIINSFSEACRCS